MVTQTLTKPLPLRIWRMCGCGCGRQHYVRADREELAAAFAEFGDLLRVPEDEGGGWTEWEEALHRLYPHSLTCLSRVRSEALS